MRVIDKRDAFVRVLGVRMAETDSGAVLLDPIGRWFFALNDVGVTIWRLLDRPVGVSAIVQGLSEHYGDEPEVGVYERDALSFLERLESGRLIRRVNAHARASNKA